MDFVTELISKLEKGRVLARERPGKKINAKAPTKRSERMKGKRSMSPTRRDKEYAYRAARDATIVGMWQHFHRACRAKRKKFLQKAEALGQAGDEVGCADQKSKAARWVFTISLDEWALTWINCRDIIIVEGQGIYATQKTVPAWKARGKSHKTDVHLARLDVDKPWSPENTVIMYRGEVLARFDGGKP